MLRLAVLADIHGNLPALDAVIHELERLEPDCVLLNGDIINGAPMSSEVIDRIRPLDWIVVRGNHEFYYLDFDTEHAIPGSDDPERWGQLHWMVEQMRPDQGRYLATLPDERTLYFPGAQPIRVAHGVPGQNRVGFYPRQPMEEIVPKLLHIAESTIISAHTHVQIDRYITDNHKATRRTGTTAMRMTDAERDADSVPSTSNPATPDPAVLNPYVPRMPQPIVQDIYTGPWHLINPGSVGLPLNKDIRAQFAILENKTGTVGGDNWQAHHYAIEYDIRPVLDAFVTSGMMEAGGPMSRLFYWEICTAEPEIIYFFRWCAQSGYSLNMGMSSSFADYVADTRRDQFVRVRDPVGHA